METAGRPGICPLFKSTGNLTAKINDYAISATAKAISKTIDTLAQGCKPASVVELYHNAEDALIRGGVSETNPGRYLFLATENILIK